MNALMIVLDWMHTLAGTLGNTNQGSLGNLQHTRQLEPCWC